MKLLKQDSRDKAYIYVIAFCESFFFPFPVEPMVVSFVWKHPRLRNQVCFWAAVASVLGGAVGYCGGAFAFLSFGMKCVSFFSLDHKFLEICDFVQQYGFVTMLCKIFLPIPFKVMAVVFGFVRYNFLLFVMGSFIARGLRFFLVAYFCEKYKGRFRQFFVQRISWLKWGYLLCTLIALIFFLLHKR